MDGETRVEGTVGGNAGGYVEFWEAGASAKGEFHCAECGYGVIVSSQLPACPMCGGGSWEQAPWTPFARAAAPR